MLWWIDRLIWIGLQVCFVMGHTCVVTSHTWVSGNYVLGHILDKRDLVRNIDPLVKWPNKSGGLRITEATLQS